MSRIALRDTEAELIAAQEAYNRALQATQNRDDEFAVAEAARDKALSNPNLTQAEIDPICATYDQAKIAMEAADRAFSEAHDRLEGIDKQRRERRAYLRTKKSNRDPTQQISSFPDAANTDLATIVAYQLEEFNVELQGLRGRHYWQIQAPANLDTTDGDLRRRILQSKNRLHINFMRWVKNSEVLRVIYDTVTAAGFTFKRHQRQP